MNYPLCICRKTSLGKLRSVGRILKISEDEYRSSRFQSIYRRDASGKRPMFDPFQPLVRKRIPYPIFFLSSSLISLFLSISFRFIHGINVLTKRFFETQQLTNLHQSNGKRICRLTQTSSPTTLVSRFWFRVSLFTFSSLVSFFPC